MKREKDSHRGLEKKQRTSRQQEPEIRKWGEYWVEWQGGRDGNFSRLKKNYKEIKSITKCREVGGRSDRQYPDTCCSEREEESSLPNTK